MRHQLAADLFRAAKLDLGETVELIDRLGRARCLRGVFTRQADIDDSKSGSTRIGAPVMVTSPRLWIDDSDATLKDKWNPNANWRVRLPKRPPDMQNWTVTGIETDGEGAWCLHLKRPAAARSEPQPGLQYDDNN